MKRIPFNLTKPFGIELEFICGAGYLRDNVTDRIAEKFNAMDSDGELGWNIRSYSGGWSRDGLWNPTGWMMKTDGTAHANSSQRRRGLTEECNELVSPKLVGMDGFAQLKVVLDVMNDMGCEVNINCGLHVHHDVTDIKDKISSYTLSTRKKAGRVLANLVLLTARWEKIIYLMVPKSRRFGGSHHKWAKSINDYYTHSLTCEKRSGIPSRKLTMTQRIATVIRRVVTDTRFTGSNRQPTLSNQRAVGLNLHKFWLQGSVEFRYQGGTLNYTKILNWVVFTQAFVNTAKEKTTINHLYADITSLSFNRQIDWMKRNLGMFKATENNPVTDEFGLIDYGHELVADCSGWVNERINTLNPDIDETIFNLTYPMGN